MKKQTKINLLRWQGNVAGRLILHMESKLSRRPSHGGYDFDREIRIINDRLRETPFIDPIREIPVNDNLRGAIEDAMEINDAIIGTLNDIDEMIDAPFFDVFNDDDGVLESLEHSNLYNYQVENRIGLTTTRTEIDEGTGQVITITEPKATIGLHDILNNDILKDKHGIPSFSQMFQSQFDALPSSERLQASILANEAELMRLNQKLEQHPHLASELEAQILAVRSRIDTETNQLETFDGMTFDSYIQMMLASGNVVHSVDRGLLSLASDVTDIFGIVSAVGWVTGRNFITGERLTTAEQRAAGFNALINVASLAASMTGAGLAKKAGGSAVRYLAADIASTALGGVSGMATAGLLDYMNAPPWLQTLGGMGVGFGVGMGANIALTDGLNVRNVGDNWAGFDFSNPRDIWRNGLSVEHRNILINAGLNEDSFTAVLTNPNYFDQLTGREVWPGTVNPRTGIRDINKGGFLNGQFTEVNLPPNTAIDRFGHNYGTFFAQDGLPLEQRAMSPTSDFTMYNRYRVTAPLPARQGVAAPWFDMPGGGLQFQLDPTFVSTIRLQLRPRESLIDALIRLEYLEISLINNLP